MASFYNVEGALQRSDASTEFVSPIATCEFSMSFDSEPKARSSHDRDVTGTPPSHAIPGAFVVALHA